MAAVDPQPDLVRRIDRVTATALEEQLRSETGPVVVDVRAPAERQTERIEGSLGIPLNHLLERLGEVPRDRPVVVHCQGGYRSAIAASLLAEHGVSTRVGSRRRTHRVEGLEASDVRGRVRMSDRARGGRHAGPSRDGGRA